MRALPWLAVAGAAVLVAPAAAGAGWREQRLPAPGDARSAVSPPALATNERGDTAVAWRADKRSYLAVRRAGRTRFGRRITLTSTTAPRVAVLADGTVLVAARRNDGTTRGRRPCCRVVYVQRLRPRSRALTRPRAVTVRGADIQPFGWWLGDGPGGRAALIALAGDEIELVASRRHGIFGVPTWPTQGRYARPVFVGFGGDGRGAGLWVEGSNHEQRLRGAPIGRDGGVGATRTYVPAPDPAPDFAFLDASAGLDRRSRLAVLFSSTGHQGLPASVTVATGDVARALGGLQVLDRRGGLGAGLADPRLAVAPDGRAIAVWRPFGSTGQQTRIAIRTGPTRSFRVLPEFAGNGTAAQPAVLPGGHGVLVVGRPTGAAARGVRSDGRLSGERTLRGSVMPMGVATAAAAGRITLAWGVERGVRVATYSRSRR